MNTVLDFFLKIMALVNLLIFAVVFFQANFQIEGLPKMELSTAIINGIVTVPVAGRVLGWW